MVIKMGKCVNHYLSARTDMTLDVKTIVIALASLALGFFMAALLDEKNHAQEAHTMHSTMEGMTAGLEGKTGEEFDKAFLEEMIVHHEGAIEMAEMLLANTQRPELKMLGENIIAAQTGEVEIMKGWLAAWY